MSSGPIYNAVRASGSTAVHTVSPTTSTFSGSTMGGLSKADLRDATRHRKGFAIFTSVMFFIAMCFLVILQVGNVSNKVVADLYMFKIDVSKIVPEGAKSLGLHDFYQVGLWNFCEGFNDKGITACSKPSVFFWFNPVQIIVDEMLQGDSLSLPVEVTDYLSVIRGASHVMFGMFFATTFSSFICVFLCPLAVYSKLSSIPIAFFALLSGLCTLIASCISAGMWTIFKNTILQYGSDLNLVPTIGTKMVVFGFIAAGCSMFAALGQLGLLCCGTSRRDIKTGRRVGRRQRTEKVLAVEENPALRRRWWGSVSN